jgi:hypothetical protein
VPPEFDVTIDEENDPFRRLRGVAVKLTRPTYHHIPGAMREINYRLVLSTDETQSSFSAH